MLVQDAYEHVSVFSTFDKIESDKSSMIDNNGKKGFKKTNCNKICTISRRNTTQCFYNQDEYSKEPAAKNEKPSEKKKPITADSSKEASALETDLIKRKAIFTNDSGNDNEGVKDNSGNGCLIYKPADNIPVEYHGNNSGNGCLIYNPADNIPVEYHGNKLHNDDTINKSAKDNSNNESLASPEIDTFFSNVSKKGNNDENSIAPRYVSLTAPFVSEPHNKGLYIDKTKDYSIGNGLIVVSQDTHTLRSSSTKIYDEQPTSSTSHTSPFLYDTQEGIRALSGSNPRLLSPDEIIRIAFESSFGSDNNPSPASSALSSILNEESIIKKPPACFLPVPKNAIIKQYKYQNTNFGIVIAPDVSKIACPNSITEDQNICKKSVLVTKSTANTVPLKKKDKLTTSLCVNPFLSSEDNSEHEKRKPASEALWSAFYDKLCELNAILLNSEALEKTGERGAFYFQEELIESINNQSSDFMCQLESIYHGKLDRYRVPMYPGPLFSIYTYKVKTCAGCKETTSKLAIDFDILNQNDFFTKEYDHAIASKEALKKEPKNKETKVLIFSLVEEYASAKESRNKNVVTDSNYILNSEAQLKIILSDQNRSFYDRITACLVDLIKHQLMVFFKEHRNLKLLFIPEIRTLEESLPKKIQIYDPYCQKSFLLLLYSLTKLNCFFSSISKTSLEDFIQLPETQSSRSKFALTLLYIREIFMVRLLQGLGLRNITILKYAYFLRCESTFLLSADGCNISHDDCTFNPLGFLFLSFFETENNRRIFMLTRNDLDPACTVIRTLSSNFRCFILTTLNTGLKQKIEDINNTLTETTDVDENVCYVDQFKQFSANLNRIKRSWVLEHRRSLLL